MPSLILSTDEFNEVIEMHTRASHATFQGKPQVHSYHNS